MSELTRRSLERLESEERALSARRQRIHERIDFLRSSGAGEPDAQQRLDRLVVEETEVSRKRLELHALIAERRSELGAGLPPRKPSQDQGQLDRSHSSIVEPSDDE